MQPKSTDKSLLSLQINELQEQIAALPKGSLFCSHSGRYKKYYHTCDGKSTYLSTKDLTLAKQLALKLILVAKLEDVLCQKIALDVYEETIKKRGQNFEELLKKKPFILELLSDQPDLLQN